MGERQKRRFRERTNYIFSGQGTTRLNRKNDLMPLKDFFKETEKELRSN